MAEFEIPWANTTCPGLFSLFFHYISFLFFSFLKNEKEHDYSGLVCGAGLYIFILVAYTHLLYDFSFLLTDLVMGIVVTLLGMAA